MLLPLQFEVKLILGAIHFNIFARLAQRFFNDKTIYTTIRDMMRYSMTAKKINITMTLCDSSFGASFELINVTIFDNKLSEHATNAHTQRKRDKEQWNEFFCTANFHRIKRMAREMRVQLLCFAFSHLHQNREWNDGLRTNFP